MVAYKHKNNLKELLEPTLIISLSLVILMMKCTRIFHIRNDAIHVRTLWSQKLVSNVSLQKEFTKLHGLPHVFPKV